MKKMPLSMVNAGEPFTIKRIGGKEEVKRHLEELGFVVGGIVTVISEINGSLIVNVKESRVATTSSPTTMSSLASKNRALVCDDMCMTAVFAML